jgi:hypothetical protein
MSAIATALSSARQHQERACEQQGSQDAYTLAYMHVRRRHFAFFFPHKWRKMRLWL